MVANYMSQTSISGKSRRWGLITGVLMLITLLSLGGCVDSLTSADVPDSEIDGPGKRKEPNNDLGKDYAAWGKSLQSRLKKGRHFHLLEQAVISAGSSAGKTTTSSDSVQLVLGFDSTSSVTADSILNRVARKFKIFNRYEYKSALKGAAVTVSANDLDTFLVDMDNDPDVSSTEPDPAVPVETTTATIVASSVQEIPWGVKDVGADLSWAQSGDGTGIVNVDIYVIDTGVFHSDLNVVDCLEFTGSVQEACTSMGDPGDHGTGVAAVAAAADDLDGIVGVAPGARVHAIRALNAGGNIVLGKLIKVVDYLTEQKLANPSVPMVVNMSLGADVRTTRYNALDEAIRSSIAAGIVYVFAAGNDAIDAATVTPAHVAEAITVGSYGQAHQFSWFSNYGSVIDILAPGEDVLTLAASGELIYTAGTSLAAPYVTGAAALLLAQDPTLTPAQVRDQMVLSGTAHIGGVPTGTTNKSLNVPQP